MKTILMSPVKEEPRPLSNYQELLDEMGDDEPDYPDYDDYPPAF